MALKRSPMLSSPLDPDIIALQEVDRLMARTGRVDQVAWLGERLGYHSCLWSGGYW